MRSSLFSCPALVVAICLAATAAVCHAEGFPYRAHTISETTQVRGGPGDNYAVTLELPQGAEVDVYRHDPDGWCAIRPPAGSFSLLFARHVDPLDDGLGQINKDDVPSRVGSALSDLSDVVQLRLKKGELVEILDEMNDGNENWYKIAPPAGEFRWVHASDLQLAEPVVGEEPADQLPNGANQIVMTSGTQAGWEASPAGPQSAAAANPNQGFISPSAVVAPPVAANTPNSQPAASANVSQDLTL
ncbi:MAG: SH3 domain-containing protein, partial [Pirellulaceae bacterium]